MLNELSVQAMWDADVWSYEKISEDAVFSVSAVSELDGFGFSWSWISQQTIIHIPAQKIKHSDQADNWYKT
jgi:hypothetical protein